MRADPEHPASMASNHSDLWIKAIKEILAEDGQPPMTATDEDAVRADIEKMTEVRDLQFAQIERPQ